MVDKGHVILRKVFQLINIKNERSIKLPLEKSKFDWVLKLMGENLKRNRICA